MTIRDLHEDPRKMADFMGWPYEDTERMRGGYAWNRYQMVPVSAAENVAAKYEDYRDQLFASWMKSAENPNKPQTHSQFLRECAREGLGIKGKTVADVVAACRNARPDLYTPNDFASPCSLGQCSALCPCRRSEQAA